MLPWSICVTALYWIAVFDPQQEKEPPSWLAWLLDLAMHGTNFMLVIFEATFGGAVKKSFPFNYSLP